MCIKNSRSPVRESSKPLLTHVSKITRCIRATVSEMCLLYISDSADELPWVDCGGRGIIKIEKDLTLELHDQIEASIIKSTSQTVIPTYNKTALRHTTKE